MNIRPKTLDNSQQIAHNVQSKSLADELTPKKIYKIYAISSYNSWPQKRIDENYTEHSLDQLVNLLQTENKGYHQRIDPHEYYTFFGDCDKYKDTFDKFSDLLIDFLKNAYSIIITKPDISYTENKSTKGSYHYAIPKIYCKCNKLKQIHEHFAELNKDDFFYDKQKVIDTGIYSTHWFRLPNQYKEKNKDTEHIIKQGTMKDFILGFISKESICIDDNEYALQNKIIVKSKPKKNIKLLEESKELPHTNFRKFTKMEIKMLVNMLSNNRYNYNDWLNVGICLYNIDTTYIDIWDTWSKKDKGKYQSGLCQEKWKSFSKNGLEIGSLILWAKLDNPAEYEKFIKKQKIIDIVDKYKDNFPDNKLDITNIISTDISHYVGLNDKYCPIAKDEHQSNMVYIEMSPLEYVMKCHLCIGQKYPCDHNQLKEVEIKQIFNTLNIQNLNVNIYNSENKEDVSQYDEYSYDYENVYDDLELNKLIFKSLNQTHYDIAMVLFYISKHKFMYSLNGTNFDMH